MNPDIAEGLEVKIPEVKDLKWAELFKSVSIEGNDGIAMNKRGSGVRRLILLNFFRAKAEEKASRDNRTLITPLKSLKHHSIMSIKKFLLMP
ncbi:predicted ATP-dependent endonuclease, OLD family [Prevotella intermedia]|uniref:Predicted ATP-dependent endonuclease, OLD family n=2 Tax=Prevotella intermedia TaxID=28131 RepID=A0AAD1BJB0_PREIN|nr:predicted ATP-dependent endonuclease, OLD family [Prevotella intermedia]